MFATTIRWAGIFACVLLIASCFMPWAYYADINQVFTGFYSYQNHYGKPGVFMVPLAGIIFIFMLLPYVWAKRANLFIAALLLGFAIKSYFQFINCYNAYCPEQRYGIYWMIFSAVIILIAAIFPKTPTVK